MKRLALVAAAVLCVAAAPAMAQETVVVEHPVVHHAEHHCPVRHAHMHAAGKDRHGCTIWRHNRRR